MCPILHISWDALWTPKMLYGHLNRHGHFLDIFLDINCTHFGLGHILDTFWTHFGCFLKTMCPKCVRPYIVNQSLSSREYLAEGGSEVGGKIRGHP